MSSSIVRFFHDLLTAAAYYLNDASMWLLASFVLAGLLHNVLSPVSLQRHLGNTRIVSLVKSTLSGMLLPICSCGVIPLGLGMYHSGAFLGPVLAFMAATPIINPAAMFLAYAFLGPELASIYVLVGFTAPFVIGWIGNKLGGAELRSPMAAEHGSAEVIELADDDASRWSSKLAAGLGYGFMDLGPTVSRYVVWGMLIAGLISVAVPSHFIKEYLGNPGLISIGGIAVLGAVMYVCAVGHIPFVAALLAAGASPGIAITFLIAGAATNLPELISIYNLIGRRTAAIYCSTMVILSVMAGYLTNWLLLPGFVPVFNPGANQAAVNWANYLIMETPDVIKIACSLLILVMFAYSYWPQVKEWLYAY